MAKEYWYFICCILLLLPLVLLIAVKKLNLLDIRPDHTIVYKSVGDQNLRLHAFNAKKPAGESAPALLLFHGGAWKYGEARAFYPQCRYFSERGISCFSAEYRLGADKQPDVRGAMRDARDALDYLLGHAAQLQIDSDRIFAGGGSSGGHLAATLGAPFPITSSRPAALVLYNPMLDLSEGQPDHQLVEEYWQEVSPLQHIDDAVPRSLILVGSQDPEVPLATVEAYCEALHALNGVCEMAVYQGQGHGFFNYRRGNNNYFDATNARVLEFLTGAVKNGD